MYMKTNTGPKPAYLVETIELLTQLESSDKGLATTTAHERLEHYGPNRLEAVHKESLLHRYLRQFKDLMILLLLASAVITLILGDQRTTVVLVALVLFNTIIGFTQEFKAEKLMESLERLVVSSARVVRDGGKTSEVATTDLVPGDIVYVEAGDSVPADLRIIQETELQTNDFALTGESSPSRKFTHAISGEVSLGDRHNLVFMGTTVASGEGYGVVIGTGMQTELGRIASLSAGTTTDVSPLQREMNNIAARVTQGTVVLCLAVLPIAIHANLGLKSALLFAIGIASSIIPQGLPAEINTALAQAANKLARAQALVKKLSAVETLGATNIILTDKTGTLTKNQMTVEQFMIGKDIYQVSGSGYKAKGSITKNSSVVASGKLQALYLFFTTGVFASNARISPPDSQHPVWYCIGDPTEGSLIVLANKAGLNPEALETSSPELKEFAFDSARKRMSSVRVYGDGKQHYVFVKGAPENVLLKCNDIWDHGHVRTLKKPDQTLFLNKNQAWAKNAMRNLAYAYKVLPKGTNLDTLTMEDVEKDLTLLGMVSMVDPLREEVPEAMQAARMAHISVAIVTGDYAPTAEAIARRAGLVTANEPLTIVSGEELSKLDDGQVLRIAIKGGAIFSRVSPEDKLRIVELVKSSGNVVAVTGDGINDAPALKRADIGVAMGKTGTDVAKQSAEIVLLDDSFHTLVGAVQQGRTIFQNIRKGTLSCFTSNSAELVVNLTSLAALSILGVPLALTVMEILAIDLIAELFPIAALGWDKADGELMNEHPRNLHDHILNRHSITDLLWCGILIGGLAFGNYLFFFTRHGFTPQHASIDTIIYAKATAMTYLTIVICQLANILQRRSRHGLFSRYQFHNKQLWLALLLSLTCVSFILYNPTLAYYFGAGSLGAIDWFYAAGAAAIFVTIREIERLMFASKIRN